MTDPATPATIDASEAANDADSIWSFVRPIFLGWEKLRPIYLLVNVLWCMVFATGSEPYDGFRFWMTCIAGGIVANLCYFAGPVLESYVAWLGFRHHTWLRLGLFVLGTLLTMVLAASLLSDFLVPPDQRF